MSSNQCHLLQLCNTTQKNIPYYCWQEKTDGTDRFHPGVSLVTVSEQMSLYFLRPVSCVSIPSVVKFGNFQIEMLGYLTARSTCILLISIEHIYGSPEWCVCKMVKRKISL